MQHQLALSVGRAVRLQFVFLRQRVEWFKLGQGLPAQAIKRVGMLQAIPNVTVSQSVPVMPQSSVQHMQSMAATMVELTQKNQELTREINLKKQHYEGYAEGQAQSQEDGGDAKPESQLRGTTSRRVP